MLGLAQPRAALAGGKVPVQKTIVHKGKTITVTYWMNPDKAKKHQEASPQAPTKTVVETSSGKKVEVTSHAEPAAKPSAPAAAPASTSPPAAAPKTVAIKKTITTKSGKTHEVTYHVAEKNAAKHQAKEDAKTKAAPPTPPASAVTKVNSAHIKAFVKSNGVSAAFSAVEKLGGEVGIARSSLKSWVTSSTGEAAVLLRGAALATVASHGIDVEIEHVLRADKTKRYDNEQGVVRKILETGAGAPKVRATLQAMAVVSQAMHDRESMTLYRGIGDRTAQGLRDTGGLRTGALVSFAETYEAALKFGDNVVAARVPRSSFVISHRAFAQAHAPGLFLPHEKEIVISTHGVMTGVKFVTGNVSDDHFDDVPADKGTAKKAGLHMADLLPAVRPLPAGARRRTFAGLPIVVEHPAGSIRFHGDVPVKMQFDYGYIEGYLSADGEALDCYLGPEPDAEHVHVVHQLRAPSFRGHDEDKVMLGFADAESAKAAYLAHRNEPRAFQGMTVFTVAKFKGKLRRRAPGSTTKIRARALAALRRRTAKRLGGRPNQYHDQLRKRGQQLAAAVLAPYLAAIKAAVDAASSPADARRRVLERFKNESPDRLAELVRKTNVLGHLSGNFEAIKEV